jgi:hypothetical protein
LIDLFGILNSLGNSPEYPPLADHSTNTLTPWSLQVAKALDSSSFQAIQSNNSAIAHP